MPSSLCQFGSTKGQLSSHATCTSVVQPNALSCLVLGRVQDSWGVDRQVGVLAGLQPLRPLNISTTSKAWNLDDALLGVSPDLLEMAERLYLSVDLVLHHSLLAALLEERLNHLVWASAIDITVYTFRTSPP